MTNGAMMNEVFVYRIDSKGQLQWVRAVETNGVGLKSTDLDALASQGALSVFSNYLFTVNPSSNSLPLFTLNPSDASELALEAVQPNFGSFSITDNTFTPTFRRP